MCHPAAAHRAALRDVGSGSPRKIRLPFGRWRLLSRGLERARRWIGVCESSKRPVQKPAMKSCRRERHLVSDRSDAPSRAAGEDAACPPVAMTTQPIIFGLLHCNTSESCNSAGIFPDRDRPVRPKWPHEGGSPVAAATKGGGLGRFATCSSRAAAARRDVARSVLVAVPPHSAVSGYCASWPWSDSSPGPRRHEHDHHRISAPAGRQPALRHHLRP